VDDREHLGAIEEAPRIARGFAVEERLILLRQAPLEKLDITG
jgi:hypothetical protein